MIRPFGLNDIWLVRRLQLSGTPLAIEHTLTHPHKPLWTALSAPWPWAGVGVATYVLDEWVNGLRLAGFVQLMKRAARPEADLLHVAPAPLLPDASHSATEEVWNRLLNHCSLAAAGHGLQRIFASTPDGCPEQTCLKEAGYSLYARETIYRLAVAPAADGSVAGFRPQLPQDSWPLQRLYMRNTPRLVQQAEGAVTGAVGAPVLSWWEPDNWQGIVWEPAGEVRGAVQVHAGRTGHWLRIWGINSVSARELRNLVEQGLGVLSDEQSRRLPVYAAVRDYEIGLGGALTGFGFAPYADRVRFVKHTAAPVREAAPVSLATLEVRQEAPAPVNRSAMETIRNSVRGSTK